MRGFKNDELTLQQEQLIIRLKDKGLKIETIARQARAPFSQVNNFIYKILAEGNYIKMKLTRNGLAKFEPTGEEMPPICSTPCKTVIVDKHIAEQDLKRWGSKVEPIKCKLSERHKAINLRGVVIGSVYYTKRSVNQK